MDIYRDVEEGRYYSAVVEPGSRYSRPRVASFGPFLLPEDAYTAAHTALTAHPRASRIVITRGTRHPVLDTVSGEYVAQWDFDRRSMEVVESFIEDGIPDVPAEQRRAAACADEARDRAVSFYADRAMRLGALEPYAAWFARWYVHTDRARRWADLGSSYDDWLKERGRPTRAEMDAAARA
ncbi:hypothetical protein ACFUGD_01130 [Streptomyces sp. NPDC057217]|uniref:hypothetical protein n=1 Tax=Streptomyces sp. NPDC057217 TaxID=3346054 RepID=UPI003625A9A7